MEGERDAHGITETMNFKDKPAPRTGQTPDGDPLCAGDRDMTANRRRTDAVARIVGHRLSERHSDRFPDARLAPSSEALIDRQPLAVLLRQIPPGHACPNAPQYAIDDLPIVKRGTAPCVLVPPAGGL